MPLIVNAAGDEVLVEQKQFDALQREVSGERRDYLLTSSTDGSSKIKLWDCITQDWTRPLPGGLAYKHYMRKVIVKCSICDFASTYDKGVAQHIQAVEQNAETHSEAKVTTRIGERGNTVQICSGCDAEFSARKNQAKKHIESINTNVKIHTGKIEAYLVNQFSLQPSEPVIMRSELIRDGTPEVNQKERNAIPRLRRRRSRRNRGKRNGHSD